VHAPSQRHVADRPALKGAPAGTLGWLAACYFASVEFRRLDTKSQYTRRGLIEDCLREPRKPASRDLMRDCPVSILSPAHVKMLRDRKAETPAAANNRRKYLSSMFGWAVEHGLLRFNRPARSARSVTPAPDSTPGRSTRSGNSRKSTRSAPKRGSPLPFSFTSGCAAATW
jgi:hypothetical protein